jgi:hypothetical protein
VPLLNKGLAQGQAAAGAVLEQPRHAAPYVALAQQHPWIVPSSALLVGYLVREGRTHVAAPVAQPRRPPTARYPTRPEECTSPSRLWATPWGEARRRREEVRPCDAGGSG